MDHEARIAHLEKQIKKLQILIEAAGFNQTFLPLPQAAKVLKVNSWVIRDRIKADPNVSPNVHYRLNGSRYLINVDNWQKLIDSDARAKQM